MKVKGHFSLFKIVFASLIILILYQLDWTQFHYFAELAAPSDFSNLFQMKLYCSRVSTTFAPAHQSDRLGLEVLAQIHSAAVLWAGNRRSLSIHSLIKILIYLSNCCSCFRLLRNCSRPCRNEQRICQSNEGWLSIRTPSHSRQGFVHVHAS